MEKYYAGLVFPCEYFIPENYTEIFSVIHLQQYAVKVTFAIYFLNLLLLVLIFGQIYIVEIFWLNFSSHGNQP